MFGNSSGNSYTKFVILDIKFRFTCSKSDLTKILSSLKNIMTRIVDDQGNTIDIRHFARVWSNLVFDGHLILAECLRSNRVVILIHRSEE